MSITVVSVRDDSGAPSTREVYAGAASYKIGSGNLEILSPEPRLLALYPSGNWLSVYIDDAVRVLGAGSADEAGDESADSALASDADVGTGTDSDGDTDSDVDGVEVDVDGVEVDVDGADVDVDGADVEVDGAAESGLDSDLPEEAPAEVADLTQSDSDTGPEPDATDAAAEHAAAPDVAQPTVDEFVDEPVTERVDERVAAARAPVVLPPGMRSVRFGPRILKPPSKPEAPVEPRMTPVVFRPRTFTVAPKKAEPAAKPRMMPVVFRSRSARSKPADEGEAGESG